jgi:hypothetical protein
MTKFQYSKLAAVAALACMAGCTVMPTGPDVTALPGTGKTFDQFRADDASCRQFAYQQIGGAPAGQTAGNNAVGVAVLGTALGAAAGAAFGGGRGAAVGAGAGLLAGSAMGANSAQASAYEMQPRYDSAYMQCMYAAGNRVPISGNMVTAPPNGGYAPPPAPQMPPPGIQPPPPAN